MGGGRDIGGWAVGGWSTSGAVVAVGLLKALELRGNRLVELEERAKRMLASYTVVLVSHAAELLAWVVSKGVWATEVESILKDFGEAALRAIMLERPSNFVQVQGR